MMVAFLYGYLVHSALAAHTAHVEPLSLWDSQGGQGEGESPPNKLVRVGAWPLVRPAP